MDILKDRRTVIAAGAAVALAAGLGVAALMVTRAAGPSAAPPAAQGGLVVQTGRDDDVKLDPGRPLRCFVGGQFAGELALGECARRNGVATGALDVGLDPSGALAASNGASSDITPLPPQTVTPLGVPDASPVTRAQPPSSASGVATAAHLAAQCLSYGAGGWVQVSAGGSLAACVQALYSGRCERPGGAAYGRWADNTLRLISGRVEISSDNRDFRTLVRQGPDCELPQP